MARAIVKAEKVKLTAGRIADFQCPGDKAQAFLWCDDPSGLAVRATAGGTKAYVFQAKVKGKSMRVTIGDVNAWSISDASKEARRLQILIDNGQDPRHVRAEQEAAREAARLSKEAEAAALVAKQARESVTLGEVWPVYVADRAPHWSEHHRRDHMSMIQAGGEKRKRSRKLTEPGPLASLANVRLVDLTMEHVEAWAKGEAKARPTRARLALRLLKACLHWCAVHPAYAGIGKVNAAQSKKARESLGKSKAKNDVLQREQLAAWFVAVRQIGNLVISAYLQSLLLTGARRNELATLRWADVDFQWKSLTIRDKVEGERTIPLTPYVEFLISALPRRKLTSKQIGYKKDRDIPNPFVFSSPTSKSGRLIDPSIAHRKACSVAALDVSLHGLRRSFATLSEWTETPAGIAAQIQGHAPQGVREQNYIRRPLDLRRMWHVKIEAWVLEQAGVEFVPAHAGLRVVASA